MASNTTSGCAANTAVRAFLAELSKEYYNKKYSTKIINNKNVGAFTKKTKNAKGEVIWKKIKGEFDKKCCYCETEDEHEYNKEKNIKDKYTGKIVKLEFEHLVGINKTDCGLNLPSNVVPACTRCNQGKSSWHKIKDNKNKSWEDYVKAKHNKKSHIIIGKINDYIKKYKKKYEWKTSKDDMNKIKLIAVNLSKFVNDDCHGAFDDFDKPIKKLKRQYKKTNQNKE